MKDKIYSLDDIKKILDSKDKIISITSKWWKRPWLSPNDDTVTENVISRIEKIYDNFWDYNIEEKEKALKYMQRDVNSLLNTLSNIKKDLSNKEKNLTKLWYTDLTKDVSELNKETDNLLNNINKQADKATWKITDILPWDTEVTKKEEVKQVATPVVDTTTNIASSTTTQPVQNTQQRDWYELGRQIVYDNKKNVIWFVSALKDKDWKNIIKIANWVDDANKQIKEWVIWHNAKLYNSLSWEETTDWVKQITKQQTDLRNRLIKDWFTEKELNERWIY